MSEGNAESKARRSSLQGLGVEMKTLEIVLAILAVTVTISLALSEHPALCQAHCMYQLFPSHARPEGKLIPFEFKDTEAAGLQVAHCCTPALQAGQCLLRAWSPPRWD